MNYRSCSTNREVSVGRYDNARINHRILCKTSMVENTAQLNVPVQVWMHPVAAGFITKQLRGKSGGRRDEKVS